MHPAWYKHLTLHKIHVDNIPTFCMYIIIRWYTCVACVHDYDVCNPFRLEKEEAVCLVTMARPLEVDTRIVKVKMILSHYLVMSQKIPSRYICICCATDNSCMVHCSMTFALSLGLFPVCLEYAWKLRIECGLQSAYNFNICTSMKICCFLLA